jgi:hypothetical protein
MTDQKWLLTKVAINMIMKMNFSSVLIGLDSRNEKAAKVTF